MVEQLSSVHLLYIMLGPPLIEILYNKSEFLMRMTIASILPQLNLILTDGYPDADHMLIMPVVNGVYGF